MTKLDRIKVENLCVHGFHGVMPQEREIGQKFYIDLECAIDTRSYADSDAYTKAICYAGLCETIQSVSSHQNYNLIETFADRIAMTVLSLHQAVEETIVTIRKPSAPISAALDTVSVTIYRARADL